MSLDFLSWQEFILVTIGGGITLIVYGVLKWNKFPKAGVYGFICMGMSGISMGLIRLAEVKNILVNLVPLYQGFKFTAILGMPLLLIGTYKKIKKE